MMKIPQENLPQDASPAEVENIRLKGELASSMLQMQRIAELTSNDSQHSSSITCPAVEKSAGFVEGKDKPSNLAPHQKRRFRVVEVKNSLLRTKLYKKDAGVLPTKKSHMERKVLSAEKLPIVHPTMANSEVKRRTGFCDVSTLLAYVIVVCNGDFDRIRKKRTSLTWFEEWFLYFEWKYHITNVRQQDMEVAWGIEKN